MEETTKDSPRGGVLEPIALHPPEGEMDGEEGEGEDASVDDSYVPI